MRRSGVVSRSRSAIAALVLLATLAACATTPQPEPPGYADLLALGHAAAEAGRSAAALDAYTRAGQVDPARKEPWLRIAMLQRDAGRPVQALAAAEETLQRDPSDALANEVFIASGLRIARQTMQRLRAGGVAPDAAEHGEARELVALMGQVFGAESLVPDDVKARYAKRAAVQCAAIKARLRQPTPPKPQADPFDVLGGN